MSISTKSVLLRKNFVYYKLNRNSRAVNKGLNTNYPYVFNLVLSKQIKMLVALFGKSPSRKSFFIKNYQRNYAFNSFFKKKFLHKNKIKFRILFLLKKKQKLYFNRNSFFSNTLSAFLWKSWNSEQKFSPFIFKLHSFFFVKFQLRLLKKLFYGFFFNKHFSKTKNLLKFFFWKKRKRHSKIKYFLLSFNSIFFTFFKIQVVRLKFFLKHYLNLNTSNNNPDLQNLLYSSIKRLVFLRILINFFFKQKLIKKKLFTKLRKNYLLKKRKRNFLRLKKLKIKVGFKRIKFFNNYLKRYFFNFGDENKKKRIRKFFKCWFKNLNFKKKIKIYRKKSKKKNNSKRFLNLVNKTSFLTKKPLISIFLGWKRFLLENIFNFKRVYKKKKLFISSVYLQNLNKNLVFFLNVFHYKKKPIQGFQIRQLTSHELVLLKINRHKNINKVYKHLKNILLSISLLMHWLKFFKFPITLKVNNMFSFKHKGWNKVFRILKKNFFLKRYTSSHSFSGALSSMLMTVYFRNTLAFTRNLCFNLERQWRHRQHLFFSYFLTMSVLWQFEFKKITSFRRVKTIYTAVRGKINSGTRTKYFQIKAAYKPSFITLRNHLNFSFGTANARTGTFGIQSWIHY